MFVGCGTLVVKQEIILALYQVKFYNVPILSKLKHGNVGISQMLCFGQTYSKRVLFVIIQCRTHLQPTLKMQGGVWAIDCAQNV